MGGKRAGAGRHKRDCECEKCHKKHGSRPTTSGVASRVLAQIKSEQTWIELVTLEKRRLGLLPRDSDKTNDKCKINSGEFQGNFSIIPLTNLLRYLEDRAYGRPVDTVNHLHDKPLEVNATLTLGEGMKLAMQKAEERVRSRR